MTKDPYRYFRIEARELLEGLAEGVLQLEQGEAAEDEAVRGLLRLAHTLKGAARVVKLARVAEQAHAIEDLLAPYRASSERVREDAAQAMLERLDAIRAELDSLDGAKETARGDVQTAASPAESFESVRIRLSELDGLLQATLEASVALERLRSLNGRRAPAAWHINGAGVSAAAMPSTLRTLDSERQLGLPSTESEPEWEGVGRKLEELREQVSRLRLLPADTIFPDLKRAVRDAAKSTHREVRLETLGGELRVDAHVLANVRSALLHLVRNAVVHGVEDAATRHAAGKPEAGLIRVSVQRRGHRVAFVCRDDGGGIDIESIRRAAERRGLLEPSMAASLEWDPAIEMLLQGGLTTSQAITEVAGRGVGLDVARETAERLNGEIRMESSPESGTAVELLVPLSLSSMPALAVAVAGSTALIPLDVVRETLWLAPDDVHTSMTGESVLWNEEPVPLVPLARVLKADTGRGNGGEHRKAVVLPAGQQCMAVGVDGIDEVRTVVVHALPQMSCADAIVAGAALDRFGQPQLVLSPGGIADALRMDEGRDTEQALPIRRPPVLVIDDSLTTRMMEQSILESAGYEVELCESAEEALHKARQRQYGLFVVDVEMPGMDGFEFITRVRNDPELSGTPSILVTSRASAEDRRRGTGVGAEAYFVKSEFDQTLFLENVQRLIG